MPSSENRTEHSPWLSFSLRKLNRKILVRKFKKKKLNFHKSRKLEEPIPRSPHVTLWELCTSQYIYQKFDMPTTNNSAFFLIFLTIILGYAGVKLCGSHWMFGIELTQDSCEKYKKAQVFWRFGSSWTNSPKSPYYSMGALYFAIRTLYSICAPRTKYVYRIRVRKTKYVNQIRVRISIGPFEKNST